MHASPQRPQRAGLSAHAIRTWHSFARSKGAQALAYRYLPSGAADASLWIAHALGIGFDLDGPAGRGQHPDRSDRRVRDR
jgi:hypothetical protein